MVVIYGCGLLQFVDISHQRQRRSPFATEGRNTVRFRLQVHELCALLESTALYLRMYFLGIMVRAACDSSPGRPVGWIDLGHF